MLNAEVMKPFVVVERLFLHGHSDEGISVQNTVTSVQLVLSSEFQEINS